MKHILLCIIALRLHVQAATYYVDSAAGNNANPGSEAQPWQTLAKAETDAGANDTINLKRGGAWSENFVFPADGMTLQAYGTGELPIIDGGGTIDDVVVANSRTGTTTRFIWIRNGGGATGALWMANSGTNTIEDCKISTHTFDACLDCNVDGYIIVRRCIVSGAADDGLTLHDNASALVENCVFHNNYEAINNSGAIADGMTLTVNDCAFYHNGDGLGGGGDIGALSETVSTFNRCTFSGRSDSAAFKFITGSSGSMATWNYCTFNGAAAAASAQPAINCDGPMTFNNSVFYGGAGHGGISASAATIANNCIFTNWYRCASITGGGSFTKNYCITHAVSAGTVTADNNSLGTADPQLAAPSAGNFRLTASSTAALNAGTNLSITTDKAGRAVAATPDVGAYEYWTSTGTGTAASATATRTKVNR